MPETTQGFDPQMVEELMEFVNKYPMFARCAIETHDDNKENKSPTLYSRSPEIDIEKLTHLNQQGAGVFFSINPMVPGKREKEAITDIVTWACDIDHLSKEEQWILVEKSPIKPSCIVESKRSLHLYWFAKDGTKKNWEQIQSRII